MEHPGEKTTRVGIKIPFDFQAQKTDRSGNIQTIVPTVSTSSCISGYSVLADVGEADFSCIATYEIQTANIDSVHSIPEKTSC